jgi:hypothetical protein
VFLFASFPSSSSEAQSLTNMYHMWVVYAVSWSKVSSFLLFDQYTPQQLTTNSLIHCTNVQTSHMLLCMATTVMKQKGKDELIVEV